MFTSTQQPTVRQEFGTAKGWRIFIYLLAPPLALGFLVAPFFIWDGQQPGFTIVLSVAMLGMAAFFVYGLLETYKAKHVITADSLLYEGAFRRKIIPLANLKGYRIDQQYTRFYSINPADPTIRIGYTSENYEAMQQWFAERYPDLDQQEQAEANAQLLTDTELGTSVEDREITLANARQTAKYLNIAGGVAGAWLFFLPEEHYRWAVALAMAVPLLAVAALWQHAGVLRPEEKKNSAHPSLTLALAGPSTMLLLRALLDFEILAYAPLWPWVAAVSAALALGIVSGSWPFLRRNNGQVNLLLSAVLFAAMYGFGTAIMYNCAFDDSPATHYQAQVLGKHISSGKTTTYYLQVGPWGPRTEAADVSVDADFYQQKNTGSQVRVYLRAGRLEVPWFMVAN